MPRFKFLLNEEGKPPGSIEFVLKEILEVFELKYTPLLNGPISKNREQRSGILHIVRDP